MIPKINRINVLFTEHLKFVLNMLNVIIKNHVYINFIKVYMYVICNIE